VVIKMDNLTVTWQTILLISGGIITLNTLGNVVFKWTNPYREMKKKIDRHDEKLSNDNERLKEIEGDNKIILKSLLALIDNKITDNSIENLKKVRNELNNHLIDK